MLLRLQRPLKSNDLGRLHGRPNPDIEPTFEILQCGPWKQSFAALPNSWTVRTHNLLDELAKDSEKFSISGIALRGSTILGIIDKSTERSLQTEPHHLLELIMKRFIFLALVMTASPGGPALAQCNNDWIFTGDGASELCNRLQQYNGSGEIPIFRRRPECPKDGPDSKCNPTSITVPGDNSAAVVTISPEFVTVRRLPENGVPEELEMIADGIGDDNLADIGGWSGPQDMDAYGDVGPVVPESLATSVYSNYRERLSNGWSMFILLQD